jgi:CubicO group peptidase (beta-lactamase class C family)
VSASDELDRLLAAAQAEQRMPAVGAAVFRGGELLWERALGLADVERGQAAAPDHVYRIGSITKTFTAVLVLQLREEGALRLDDELRVHVDEVPAGPTVRQALAHLSGIQREPPGEIWETMRPPSRAELLSGLGEAEGVLAPGERWHYSNLAYGVLGELVARLRGAPYGDVLPERVLEPLGLSRTGLLATAPAATGYFVDPWSDAASVEPDLELSEATAALGQLWSTTGDLVRFGAFLARGDDRVLARPVLDEMARVAVIADEERWTVAWGLGLGLYRRGDRIYAGHGGAMPGFLASLVVSRRDGIGAVVLTNSGAGSKVDVLSLDLAEAAYRLMPATPHGWAPDEGAPSDIRPLLGSWWTEGNELRVTWRDGLLRSELLAGSTWNRHSTFEPEQPDVWRCVAGRECGELLRVVRDDAGTPVKLYFATYPCTREPSTFGFQRAPGDHEPRLPAA